jgi:acetylornithine deacetylase/succinyl-diaminopimelate desuccinylase-like protein
MMGSRVHAADLLLEDALAITDDEGISVREAVRTAGQSGALTPSPRGWSCWLEAHIEQGPILEATGTDIGIVTGTVHARYFQLIVTGEPSHVGPTTMDRRRDSLAATAEIILAVERIALGAEPGGRASASWIENYPNARGNVANITRLHCDVRHERAERAATMDRELRDAIAAIATRRGVSVAIDPTPRSVVADPRLGVAVRQGAGTPARHARLDRPGRPRFCTDRAALPQRHAVRAQRRWHHPQPPRIFDQGACCEGRSGHAGGDPGAGRLITGSSGREGVL